MEIHTRTGCMTDIIPTLNPTHPNQHPNHNLLVNNP